MCTKFFSYPLLNEFLQFCQVFVGGCECSIATRNNVSSAEITILPLQPSPSRLCQRRDGDGCKGRIVISADDTLLRVAIEHSYPPTNT